MNKGIGFELFCMMRFLFQVFLVLLLCTYQISCTPKYLSFRDQYSFKSADGKPDYSRLDYWAAHPWKKDPSDSIPQPLRYESLDSSVDVFFIHPTSFTKKSRSRESNAPIDDAAINAKTDYTSILYQASVFNSQCRVFSPRYRQAHISNFFKKNAVNTEAAFATAYQDIKAAFEYYLEHWNRGRPLIIAGHSQGSLMAEKILKEYVEGKPLQQRLVAAWIAGWPVPKNYFTSLSMCTDSGQTGCLCSWRTLRRNYIPWYLKPEKGNAFATNPLTWTTGNEYAPRRLNKGSVLRDFNRIFPHTTDAQVQNGLLFVKKPKFPWSFLYFRRNYHIGDINLFYLNLRENIRQRIAAYRRK